jgi:hypothetical protein
MRFGAWWRSDASRASRSACSCLKFGLRNAPGIYPSGQHIESTVLALSRERVRRAAIGLALLKRYAPDAVASPAVASV